MAEGNIPKIPDVYLTNAVRCDMQLIPSSKRFILWLYDNYTNQWGYHGYRLDFNGDAKTAKLEELSYGEPTTTLLTFSVS